MAEMFYDDDADLSVIQSRKVAVLGYGSQGHAHALNLRDSGVDVRVGLPEGSRSRAKAEAEGLRVLSRRRGGAGGRRDHDPRAGPRAAALYAEAIEPNLADGDALFFGHGFNIRFGYIKPPAGRRRRDGRAEGPGSPGAPRVRRRPRRPRARRRRAGRDRQGAGRSRCRTPRPSAACAPAASRRRSPRRPRPTCSASRPCSAAAPRAGAGRLRDAHRGRLPARGRLLRVPARAQADRRPHVRGRHRQAALVGLRHRRVRRLRLRPAGHRRAREGRA